MDKAPDLQALFLIAANTSAAANTNDRVIEIDGRPELHDLVFVIRPWLDETQGKNISVEPVRLPAERLRFAEHDAKKQPP